jgi:hypothetical protein
MWRGRRESWQKDLAERSCAAPTCSSIRTGARSGRRWAASSPGCAIEYDPDTSEALDEFVEVGPGGAIVSWTWVATPRKKQPLDHPFAYALIRLDGADASMLHVVDAGDESRLATGARVKPRWAPERGGGIHDIECFELEETE